MKIGIFGGTFNPPHLGHLIVAEQVRIQFSLDKVFFIPSYISPHKQEGEETLSRHRFEMTSIAVQHNKWFDCLDIEIKKGGPSFTVDTLTDLRSVYKHDELFLLMGMDNYRSFHTWKEPETILTLASLIVMNRPRFPIEVNPQIKSDNISFSTVSDIGISSTDIRNKVHRGEPIRYLVPDGVLEYIIGNRLYQ